MVYMFLTVGPKGQVVIPKEIRDRFHIVPGDKMLAEDTAGGITLKPSVQPDKLIRLLEETAKSAKVRDIGPHDAYEEQMMHRDRKRRKANRGR